MAKSRGLKLNKVLLVILLGMLLWLGVDAGSLAPKYMKWEWLHTDKIAGYLHYLSFQENQKSLLGLVVPGIGYLEEMDLGIEEIRDPSYERYLDMDNYIEEPIAEVESNSLSEETKIDITESGTLETLPQAETVNAPVAMFSRDTLLDFNDLIKNNYTITSITELKPEMLNLNQALNMDMKLKQDNQSPQILIFHTHSQEGFADSVQGDSSTTIVGVGEHLAAILREEYGYNVIHDTSVYDLVNGKLDRSAAYTYAEKGVEKILAQYPSIEVIIDLHRDGVDESKHLVTEINGKPTAKIMFFNGISYSKVNGDLTYLPNPYIGENLAMSLQMKLLGDMHYPGFLRNNYINAYRYCLHYRGKSMLIEAGAQNNTLEEEKNAMEILAELLHRLLEGERAYK